MHVHVHVHIRVHVRVSRLHLKLLWLNEGRIWAGSGPDLGRISTSGACSARVMNVFSAEDIAQKVAPPSQHMNARSLLASTRGSHLRTVAQG